MKNNRYTQLKTSSTIKNSLMESAMGWKQLNGCYPTVSEFSQKINELFGVEIFAEDVISNTEEINESHLSALSSILGILFEGADHDVLGVPEGASLEDIKKAFRTKAKLTHPDLGGSPSEWKIISDAYSRLIGPSRTGPTSPSSPPPPPPGATKPTPSPAPSPTPSGGSGMFGKALGVMGKVAKAIPAIGVLSYAASKGQEIAGEKAKEMGAGPGMQTAAEIGGAYTGDVAGSALLNAPARFRGKQPTFKPSLGAATGFVLGSKVSDDPLYSALGSLGAGALGGALERRLLPKLGKFGKAIPGVATIATLGALASSDSAGAATPTEKQAATQEKGRGLASLTMPGLGVAMSGLEMLGMESPAAKRAREEKEQKELFKVPDVSAEEAKKGVHRYMSQWDKNITDVYKTPKQKEEALMKENTDNYFDMVMLNENLGRFIGSLAKSASKEAPDILKGMAKYAEPEMDVLKKMFFSDLEKKMAEIKPEIKLPTAEVSKEITPEIKSPEIETTKAPEVETPKPEKIEPIIPLTASKAKVEIESEPKTKTSVAADIMKDIKTDTAPETKTETTPQTKTAIQTQAQTKTKQEQDTKAALDLATKTQTSTKTQIQTQTKTQIVTQPKLQTNLQVVGAPKPITGVTPSVTTKTPSGYGSIKGGKPQIPAEPEIKKVKSKPTEEIPMVSPMGDVRYPALRAAAYGVLPIYEGIYNPKVSLQKKSEKQKYKIVVIQEGGKKVEIFASSLRGVKRAIYGKKNFRVYDAKGTEISTYFKRMQKKTQNKMKGK